MFVGLAFRFDFFFLNMYREDKHLYSSGHKGAEIVQPFVEGYKMGK